ncbi:MAG: YHS domain-containing protein [bacterium]|nr:YHS domain-containing protein [bacterium]
MNAYERYIAADPKHCRVCKAPFTAGKSAITKEFTGELYAFCSDACIAEFEEDPEKYVQFPDDEVVE